ncbi:MAG: prepilin peptidase [Peptococcaceae bacterium]|nr:prepilin peptidase [Peptococcaceae bacterium]
MDWSATLSMFFGCLLPSSIAAYTDWRRYELPDYLTLPMLGWGLAYGVYMGFGKAAITGAAAGFMLGLVSALLGQMGGGDIKFMAALGAWTGLYGLAVILIVASCLGVIWGVIRMARAGTLKYWIKKPWSRLPNDPAAPAPVNAVAFGTCLAVGLWCYILSSIAGVIR